MLDMNLTTFKERKTIDLNISTSKRDKLLCILIDFLFFDTREVILSLLSTVDCQNAPKHGQIEHLVHGEHQN